MNNIHLSKEAQNDLVKIKAYIEDELPNPSAALATVSRITKSFRILRTYAQMGAPLLGGGHRKRLPFHRQ